MVLPAPGGPARIIIGPETDLGTNSPTETSQSCIIRGSCSRARSGLYSHIDIEGHPAISALSDFRTAPVLPSDLVLLTRPSTGSLGRSANRYPAQNPTPWLGLDSSRIAHLAWSSLVISDLKKSIFLGSDP